MTDNQNKTPANTPAKQEEEGFFERIKDAGEEKLEDVKDAVTDKLGDLKDAAGDKLEDGKKAVEGFASHLFGGKKD